MRIFDKNFFSSGKKISARVMIPENEYEHKSVPAIVINHGYSGDKNEYDSMAEFLCNEGYATLQFDSRGCGNSEAVKGRMMCSTEWIEDAYNAVSYILSYDCVDQNKIGFTGCSMGGALTIVMSALDKRVKCAVAMAPVASGKNMLELNWKKFRGSEAYEHFLSELKADSLAVSLGKPSKIVSVPHALGMNISDEKEYLQIRAMNKELVSTVPLESVVNSFFLFEPDLYSADIDVPFMIIHGDMDEIVSIEQSKNLVKKIKSETKLVVIKEGLHPLPLSDKAHEVFEHIVGWFNRYLL